MKLKLFLFALICSSSALADFRSFMRSYCLECHNASKQKGDRRFDRLRIDFSNAHSAESLQEILDILNLSEMPPKKADKQPSEKELKQVIVWLTNNLQKAKEKVNKSANGRVVIRRLNKTEYRNSIRDIFDINTELYDPAMGFPDENEEEGFDNIGGALIMSEYLMSEALLAGEVIAERVIQPGPRPEVQRLSLTPELRAEASKELGKYFYINFIQNGSLIIRSGKRHWEASNDGRYNIKIKALMLNRLKNLIPSKDLRYNSSEPARLAVTAYKMTGSSPFTQKLGEFDISDEKLGEINITTELRRGSKIKIQWLNGPNGSVKRITRKVLHKYHPEALAGHKNPTQMYFGAGPEMQIKEFHIEGPFYDEWPLPVFDKYFGSLSTNSTYPSLEKSLNNLAYKVYRADKANKNPAYLRRAKKELENGANIWAAAKAGIKTMLSSPQFLYMAEAPASSSKSRLSGRELAVRMAYFLWKSSPDEELLKLAENGKLRDPKVRLTELERMLKDPRAKGFLEDFLAQWLWLETLGDMPPSHKKDKIYYQYDLEQAMAEETYLFTKDLLDKNGPLQNLLDADYTFLNEGLAKLYGVPGVIGNEFRKVQLNEHPERGGLMGQASVLTVTGNGVESLPVTRGVWILENIMGTPPPPPPPDVPEIAPDTSGTQTVRDLLAKHRENFSCNECHKKMDPFGLAMEGYDYLGRYRESYGHKSKNKNKINLTVESHDGVNFEGLAGVKEYIKSKPDMFTRCLTEKLLTYAVGRKMVFTDRKSIDAIVLRAKKEDFGLRDLLKLIILSEVFLSK
ncbi:DUF1592 domain-containing protein [Lentisphaera profundi]|uniref:DUF1592 domain-containing protein n=1 Tax=Lentisphaera profundi TaxID=1658616 RepID=A0ABY7VRJ8_9BACT|nr:DUF1592 domain-containing protein [Lentisphaera profundi]WDE96496.1 DUF1592 domain-containing protein [Lentisphaera profundi]